MKIIINWWGKNEPLYQIVFVFSSMVLVLLLLLIPCYEPQGCLLMRFNWKFPFQIEEKFGKIAINDGLHLVQSVFMLLALHLKEHPHYAELVTLFAKVRLFSFGKVALIRKKNCTYVFWVKKSSTRIQYTILQKRHRNFVVTWNPAQRKKVWWSQTMLCWVSHLPLSF